MYKTVLFDLDGTLTDSAPGIINSFIYALKKYNHEVLDYDTYRVVVGPPLKESFERFLGTKGEEEALEAIHVFREYFNAGGMFENSVYPGIVELLETLKAEGYKLVVATSKPQYATEIILDHFDLTKYFDFISGASNDEKHSDKADIIKYAVDTMGLNPCECVMVGDRSNDIVGGMKNHMATIGVNYGYGTIEEFKDATYTVDSPLEILDIVRK